MEKGRFPGFRLLLVAGIALAMAVAMNAQSQEPAQQHAHGTEAVNQPFVIEGTVTDAIMNDGELPPTTILSIDLDEAVGDAHGGLHKTMSRPQDGDLSSWKGKRVLVTFQLEDSYHCGGNATTRLTVLLPIKLK